MTTTIKHWREIDPALWPEILEILHPDWRDNFSEAEFAMSFQAQADDGALEMAIAEVTGDKRFSAVMVSGTGDGAAIKYEVWYTVTRDPTPLTPPEVEAVLVTKDDRIYESSEIIELVMFANLILDDVLRRYKIEIEE